MEKKAKTRKARVLSFSITSAILLVIFAVTYTKYGLQQHTRQKKAEIETITDFKTAQINDWLKERLADALHFSASPLYAEAMKDWMVHADPKQEKKIADRNELVRSLRGFMDVQIAVERHKLPFSTAHHFTDVPKDVYPVIDSCLALNKTVLSDFFTDPITNKKYFALVAPISDASNNLFATLVFYIDPDIFLKHVLNYSPTGLNSLNSCLVDTTGNSAFIGGVSYTASDIAQINKSNGFYSGTISGSANTLICHRNINKAKWLLISQIDGGELRREFFTQNLPVYIIVLITVLLVVLIIFGIDLQYDKKTFMQLYLNEQQTIVQLGKSEARFRAVIENSLDAILFLAPDGTVTYCAPAIKRITGRAPEDFTDQRLHGFLHGKCSDNFTRTLGQLSIPGSTAVMLCQITNTDTAYKWVEITFNNQLETDSLNVVVANLRDVDQRKMHEEKIESLLTFQSAILENAGHGIITTDIYGTLTSLNKSAEEMLGYKAEELVGKTSPQQFHLSVEIERQAKILSEKLNTTIRPGFDVFTVEASMNQPQQYEWHYQRKDGSLLPINLKVTALKDPNGNINGYMGIAIDMSGIKNAEARLSYFYELSPDIAGISRLNDGVFIDVNPAFTAQLGYEQAEAIGKSSIELGVWMNVQEREQFVQLLEEKSQVNNFGFHAKKKNGQVIYSLISARVFPFNGEKCMLFMARDISDRKTAEEEISRSESRLKSLIKVMQLPCNDAGKFLDATLVEALSICNSEIGYIYYYNEETEQFTLNSWSKNVMPECSISNPMVCYELGKTGLWGEVVRQRMPIIINDYEKEHPLKKGFPSGHVKLKNFLSIPVFADEKIVAVIGVGNKNNDYENTDILQLTLLMDTAWNMIEQKNVQRELVSSEEKYRQLFENMTSGLVLQRMVYDDDNSPLDFQFVEVNPAACSILELDEKSIKGNFFNTVYTQSRNQEWLNRLKEIDKTGIPIQFIDYNALVGKYIEWTLFRYKQNFVVALLNDVTTRVLVEKRLKTSEEKFSTIYAMVPDAIGISRLKDGKLIDANPSLGLMTGYQPEDYRGQTPLDLKVWANQEERDLLLSELQNDKTYTSREKEIQTKDGSVMNCSIAFNTINYGDEECMLFVIHDMTQIRKTQDALLYEQSFTKSLLDSVPGLVYLYDENGLLVRWNKKHISDTGFSAEELHNKNIFSWFDDENKKAIAVGIQSVLTHGHGEAEAYITYKNETQRLYYFSATKSIIDNKIYLAGIALDITDRKTANESLRQIEQRFMNIYNLTPDMVGITRQSDGKILTINPATTHLTGYSEEEALGHSTNELHWWANPTDRDKMLKYLREKGEVTNWEIGMRIKNGSVLTCLFSARPLNFNNESCLLFVVHDITEMKRHEELLRASRDRLKKAEQLGHLGYSEQVIGESRIWASAEGCAIYGFEPVDGYLPLQNVAQCIPDVRLLKDATAHLLTLGQKYDIEFLINPADGSPPKYIHAVQDVEYNEAGQPYKLLSTFHDITERKKIELEIKHINENLEKTVQERTAQLAQVNHDLEAFAYSVSHDLRAPIRHIDGFFKLLYNQIPAPNPTMVNYSEKINTATLRMSGLIDDLLAFSRLGRKEPSFSKVDINEIVHEIIDQYAGEIADRKVVWNIAQLPLVKGDKNLLKNAFENLIGNALKYTRRQEIPTIEIGSEKPFNNMVDIFVKDNGVGFDMAYRDKLFGVFQRLHSNEEFEGSGIGLANVKQIVSKHGGAIKAEGKINEGAVFTVSLPIPQ